MFSNNRVLIRDIYRGFESLSSFYLGSNFGEIYRVLAVSFVREHFTPFLATSTPYFTKIRGLFYLKHPTYLSERNINIGFYFPNKCLHASKICCKLFNNTLFGETQISITPNHKNNNYCLEHLFPLSSLKVIWGNPY